MIISNYLQVDRNFGLDLLRAIAIISVVYSHGSWLLKPMVPNINFIDGVELFFVLSGFLIGNIILKGNFKTLNEIYFFWVKRWSRTIPNYYLFIIINLLFSALIFNDINNFNIKYLFFFQNIGFSSNSENWFAESWSLTVEEWFYFLFPLLLMLVKKYFNKDFLVSLVLFFSFSIFLKYIQFKSPLYDPHKYDVLIRKITLLRFDSISIGIAFAFIKNQYFKLFNNKSFKNISLFLGIAITLLTYSYSIKLNFASSVYLVLFHHTAVGVGYACLIPYFYNIKLKWADNFFTKTITWTSLISYSLYLIHLSITMKTIRFFFWPSNGIEAILTFFIYLFVSALFAYINFICFEYPITKKLRN